MVFVLAQRPNRNSKRKKPMNPDSENPCHDSVPADEPPFKSERRALSEARKRCHSPLNKDYRHYGARGISVHPQWRKPVFGFDAFIAHIGPKPTPKHTLDRIDNTRGYEPGNVRWVTMLEQANNRRSSKLVTFEGETHTAAEWGRRFGVRRQYVANAVNKGKPLEGLLKAEQRVSQSHPSNTNDGELAKAGAK